MEFYEDLDKNMIFEEHHKPNRESILGDMITSQLKENYQKYDFYIPEIIRDKEELLTPMDLSSEKFDKCLWSYDQLKSIAGNGAEVFEAQEMTVQTKFGEYKVHCNMFNAQSYNEFLSTQPKHHTINT